MSICNHVADHLSDEQPKNTRRGKERRREERRGGGVENIAEFNLAISTGEGSERPHAQVLIFDKRSKIIAQRKSVADRMSAVLSFGARLQNQARTQMEPDSLFWGLSSSSLFRQ